MRERAFGENRRDKRSIYDKIQLIVSAYPDSESLYQLMQMTMLYRATARGYLLRLDLPMPSAISRAEREKLAKSRRIEYGF